MTKIIGLTGGIGSGKSKVLTVFEKLGVPCYKTDIVAKRLMVEEPSIKNEIIKLLGPKSYKINSLNTQFISSKIFKNKNILEEINNIVHPKVSRDFLNWSKVQNKSFLIKESAILFESGFNLYCDKIILIHSPYELRIKRIIKRDSLERQEIINRINNQMDDESKINLSDYVIENIKWEETYKEVLKIYDIINIKLI